MILFFDDEGRRVENDVDELRLRGYDVRLMETVDGAIAFLTNHGDAVEGIICDVMMPHGSSFTAEQSVGGLRSGVNLFDWVRERWPKLPFVVFTNVSAPALRQRFEDEPFCIYLEKRNVDEIDLADQVLKLIPIHRPGGSQP